MSDFQVAETPLEARAYCPGCEPLVNPVTACVYVNWCWHHIPSVKGMDDEKARTRLDPWIGL